jgi:hypothetical protein
MIGAVADQAHDKGPYAVVPGCGVSEGVLVRAGEEVTQGHGVAAAVTAFGLWDRHLTGLFEVPLHHDPFAHGTLPVVGDQFGVGARVDDHVAVGVRGHRSTFDDGEFRAALGAVDADDVSLPGRVGVERVGLEAPEA